MKPYITTYEAAIIYGKHRNFNPSAFREFLRAGAIRELEQMKTATCPDDEDFKAWYEELRKYDYCFWTWVSWEDNK